MLVSNGAYRLESLNGFGTRERIDAGVLGIVAVTVDSARDVPVLLAAEASGHVDRFRGYRSWTAPELEIDSAEQLIDVGVDGEALRLPPPLRFRSLPGALRVRTPIHAPGVAPAAAAPHGVGLGGVALLRVLSRSPRALSGGARRRRQTRFRPSRDEPPHAGGDADVGLV